MSKSETINPSTGTEIAIIGLSGRFPGSRNVEEYWLNLRDGVESISFFSDHELELAGVDPVLLGDPKYVKAKGVLENADMFDADFFGFTPREAETMDPQHRLFLECAWEALESAGYDAEKYDGLIGVYAGVGQNNYLFNNLYPNRGLMASVGDFQIMIGNEKDFVATRVSYKMNLKGPSVVVQTACSTSLVAVSQACQSLLSGECDMALAGACSLNVPQRAGYVHLNGGITSPDGHCRPFDAGAQGTVFSSGVGIVVLKRLEEAIADGDCIHAVIKGVGMNNDGSFKVGFTAPSVEGQAKAIRMAQLMAEIRPETITYVETHGTATALGDPIEVAALTQAFRMGTQKKGFCAIGSVKSNIGHTDAAAGIAGLIKTVLMLKHKMIPPSLYFEKPNPEIDFVSSPFYVNAKLSEWKVEVLPRRAGVSSFGIGGTNAHVIVEEAPMRENPGGSRPCKLLVLSARTSEGLEHATTRLVEHFKKNPHEDLENVAYTLQQGRKVFTHRRIAVCRDIPDAITVLETRNRERVLTSHQEPLQGDVVFMFTGQGAQYVNMGLELYSSEPVFRSTVDQCSEILQPYLSFDLRNILYPAGKDVERSTEKLTQTFVTQPALFTIEYALAKLWMSWGVTPAALVGHSIGEYVAACLAGVFSLEDALSLVAERGRLMQELPGGSMLVVPLAEDELRPLLQKELSLAVINAPSLCVVSGEKEVVGEFKERMLKKNIDCRYLHTSHAFHSAMMEPILPVFTERVRLAGLKPPSIPFVSNLTGTWIKPEEATSPEYWAKHLRHTVRFSDCLQELLREPSRILLEVGPGQTFAVLLSQQPAKTINHIVLSSIRHPKDAISDLVFISRTRGEIWLSGLQIDWSGYYANERRLRVPLPTYPFDRKRFWITPKQEKISYHEKLQSVAEGSKAVSEAERGSPAFTQNRTNDRLPESDVESIVVKIWQELLGIDQVAVHDNFFTLGGNSLTALRMLSQIEKVIGKSLPLSSFKSPTIRQLVDFISAKDEQNS